MIPLLRGIRVVDLTAVAMGPFATLQLAALGAEVIKVEPPGGETTRHIGPMHHPAMGAMFLNLNRGKRSLALDLKRPGARAALGRVIATADVLVHNMRRPAAARLGLDAETVRRDNPRIIHCAAIGFGAGGPRADDGAYDDVVQALSGFAALNADADGTPRYVPQIVVDKLSGLFIAEGILAALLHRERTGRAVAFEVPMFECAVHFLMVEHLAGRIFEPPLGRSGYRRLLNPWRRPYATKDGYLAVLPYTARHWRRFMELAGREDILAAPWFTDPAARAERIHELCQAIDEAMRTRTTAEWLERLREADIPHGVVNGLEDLFEDPHLTARGFFRRQSHPSEGNLNVPRQPFNIKQTPDVPEPPAPRLGEHTREILAEAGLGPDEIGALIETGAAYATEDPEPETRP